MKYVERENGVVRFVFGFSLLPWTQWEETISGSLVRSRELFVFFGPWTWQTEFVRQIENGEEI